MKTLGELARHAVSDENAPAGRNVAELKKDLVERMYEWDRYHKRWEPGKEDGGEHSVGDHVAEAAGVMAEMTLNLPRRGE